jgi:predicted SnoaL-like aldol condensation-catalyzing enzyme
MDSAGSVIRHKQSAVEFLELVTRGKIDEAYQEHVNQDGRHHNVFFPAGVPALKSAMLENHKRFPVKQFSVKHVIGDGDMVAVHSHLVMNLGEQGMVVVHLFRFEQDKIVEFWDCGQQIPGEMPNADGAF